MRRTTMAIAAGMLLATSACGAESDVSAASPSSTSTSTSSTATSTSKARESTASTTPTPEPSPAAPTPTFVGGNVGLEGLHTTALQVAGAEAWGHVVAVERIRNVVLMLKTDWTTATVDEEQANLICAGVYTWMRDASGYGSATGVSSRPFQTVGLYENTPPGKQIFAC
jgi:hypothetical protein